MELIEAIKTLASNGVIAVAVLATIVVGLPVFLHHRRQVLKMKLAKKEEFGALHAKLEKIENRCEKLQEQIVDIHHQLADERRQLDCKLSAMLPEAPRPVIMPDMPEPAGPQPGTVYSEKSARRQTR